MRLFLVMFNGIRVVLLLEGGGDYRGIGLRDIFLKAVEILIDEHMTVIEFHDSLHGFV